MSSFELQQQPRSRALHWDGCLNVRDLGGQPTEDGGETVWGRVVRADSVRGLSDDGWRALRDYGVRRIVDLRWREELAEDPPRELPMEAIHVPLLGERNETREIDAIVAEIRDPVVRRRTMYLEFLRRYPDRFVRAVAAVARAPEGAVVVHCAGGVDRTGLVSAMLLRLARVAPSDVAADYAVSEANWAPHTAAWVAEAPDDEEREWRTFLSRIPADAMLGVLETLEAQHGGVREYLLAAGAAEADLDAVRSRLRDYR